MILPDQELMAPQKREVLKPLFERKQALDLGQVASFGHYVYDVDSRENFHANSKEAYFKLVETLAAHQEYDLAAQILQKQGEKLTAYSDQEASHLLQILEVGSITGDKSGEQSAIALLAAYLLTTNSSRSSSNKKG